MAWVDFDVLLHAPFPRSPLGFDISHFSDTLWRVAVFTVTRVRISPDLSIGRVNISLFPVKDKALVLDWIKEHGSLIKDRLVRKMKGSLRKVPDFYFYLDESVDAEAEIDW